MLAAGDVLGPAEVGLLASVGASQVVARPRPLVALLSTGDELAEADTPPGALAHGQIRDSNRSMLLAAAAEAGARALDLGIAPDDEAGLAARLDAAIAAGADVLVTSGGVSMGDRDLVKPLLAARGKIHFGRVLMKPGKPLTFATVETPAGRRLLVFGLPGNPVSSIVTWHLVVVPVLRKLAGWADPLLRRVHVRTTAPLRLDPERPEYHRATAACGPGGVLLATSTGGQISSRLLSCRSANLLLELPRSAGTVPAGTLVSALVIGDLRLAPDMQAPMLQPAVEAPKQAGGGARVQAVAVALPTVGVLTVSDRASAGVYEDVSVRPALRRAPHGLRLAHPLTPACRLIGASHRVSAQRVSSHRGAVRDESHPGRAAAHRRSAARDGSRWSVPHLHDRHATRWVGGGLHKGRGRRPVSIRLLVRFYRRHWARPTGRDTGGDGGSVRQNYAWLWRGEHLNPHFIRTRPGLLGLPRQGICSQPAPEPGCATGAGDASRQPQRRAYCHPVPANGGHPRRMPHHQHPRYSP